MRYVDEYRDPAAARRLVTRITELAGDDHFKFMEVCGGHTHTIYRHGIEHVLPEQVELVHGPGCPVCVIPMGRVDDAIAIAETPGVIFTSFGDMMRVPGSNGNLLGAKARGADVRFVYSPLDALQIAVENPTSQRRVLRRRFRDDRTVDRGDAVAGARDERDQLPRLLQPRHHRSADQGHPRIARPPPRRLPRSWPRVDRGRQSARTGSCPRSTASHWSRPASNHSTSCRRSSCCSLQIRQGRCEVENQYSRVVRDEGNPRALEILAEVFELRPHFEWRGLGFISQSAFRLRPEFAPWDAELKYSVPGVRVADPKACQCGEVLKGVIKPWECKVFGTACTPETPIGTCMVSSEGACAAYYNFGRLHREAAVTLGRSPASV